MHLHMSDLGQVTRDINPLLQRAYASRQVRLPEFRDEQGNLEARYVTTEEVMQAISPSFTQARVSLPSYYSGPVPASYYGQPAAGVPGQFQFMQQAGLPYYSQPMNPYSYGGYGSVMPFMFGMGQGDVFGADFMGPVPEGSVRSQASEQEVAAIYRMAEAKAKASNATQSLIMLVLGLGAAYLAAKAFKLV